MTREQRRERILAIVEEMVSSRIAAGEVDPENDEALRAATKAAVADATAAVDAAIEWVRG